jgi:hypothetical protein
MRRLLLAACLLAAAPAAAQTYPDPPLFFTPSNVAVETAGIAEVRIIRGSPSTFPSVFHVTTDDFSMISTAIWPADYPTKVDITVTIQPGQMIGTAMIPLTHHDNFVDTKIIAVKIEPVSNAEIDRTIVPLFVIDGDKSHMDVWQPAPAIVKDGFVQLRIDAFGAPKSEGCCGTVDYTNIYPWGSTGEVFRVIDSGYSNVTNRKVWHVVKLNRVTRDAWFYEDDLKPVQPAPGVVI